MNMRNVLYPALCVGLLAAACTGTDVEDVTPEDLSATGLALSMDYLGDTDVKGFRYIVTACGSEYPVVDKNKYLEDLTLPGMIPAFEHKPFDAHSKHLFSDHFMVLPKGCYDVKVIPIKDDKQPSKDCAKASAHDVKVYDGLTTEILLVSQCKGEKRGGLDVIAALNHPPVIKNLKFDPSKFLKCPEYGKPEVILCATAYDPDKDPLEFEWTQIGGPDVVKGPIHVSTEKRYGKVTECVKFVFERESDEYEFKVTVYDLFHSKYSTKENPKLIRAEKWYEKNGYGDVKSRASLKFPTYVSCKKKPYEPEPDAGMDIGDDVGDEDDVVNGKVCPRTQGYWGNHYDGATPVNQDIPWPIIGAETDAGLIFCPGDDDPLGLPWVEIMQINPEGGSMWVNLAHQYIAAKLNVAADAKTVYGLGAALERAKEILEMCDLLTPPPTDLRHEAEALARFLDDYNNGVGISECPNHESFLYIDSL